MTKCPTCWENNPAEIHTCTPWLYMNEHEKLKIIIDKIWYESKIHYDKNFWYTYYIWPYPTFDEPLPNWEIKEVDVREIIFTQEFMSKFIGRRKDWKLRPVPCLSLRWSFYEWLMENLDNPVDYLYNLITNE